MNDPPSGPGEDVGLRGLWTFTEPLSERFTGSGRVACYAASGTVVLVKHGLSNYASWDRDVEDGPGD